jgi:hypothetical protein
MGAFVLITDKAGPDPQAVETKARASFARQGFAEPNTLRYPGGTLLVYAKQVAPVANLVRLGDDDFCAATGTFHYKGATGKSGLGSLHADFDIASKTGTFGLVADRLHGAFGIILRKDGRTFVFIDRVGVYKVYRDEGGTIFSSSFLAVLETTSRRRADIQAVYEYVFQGATYGGDTLAEDIQLLSPDHLAEPGVGLRFGAWPGYGVPEIARKGMDHQVEQIHSLLSRQFGDMAKAFDGHIDTALSGGYDSRLILAQLFSHGVRPDVHVYGKSTDPDVVVAKRIAAGEGFPLNHEDKGQGADLPLDQAEESISRTFHAFDGFPNDGVFDSGRDLASRKERCRTGALMLNGGGGEVFRNFFYLPDRTVTVRQMMWCFYTQFDPAAAALTFSEDDFHARLGEKAKATLGLVGERLSRAQVELFYPLFRCRYWMGRNNAVNSRFGSALTPFIDDALIRQTVSVPLTYKNFGQFEARLIAMASPALAGYQSDYGYPFDAPPPLSARLKSMMTYLRPPTLRRYTFRLKSRRQTPTHPEFLQPAFLNRVMEPGFPRTSALFHADKLTDTGQFNRLCTVEYLFQKMDMASDTPGR